MSHPTSRVLIPVISGVSLFALGFWAGNRQTTAPEGASANSGAAEAGAHLPPRPAASDRPLSFPEGGGGTAGGGAPGPKPAEESAMDLARILENPDRRGREQDLESLGARDLANGNDWKAAAASIGDLVDRGAYLEGVIGAWSTENPRAALEYLGSLNLSSRVSLVPQSVSIWADQDPAAAEAWVLSLSNGEVKDQAVESLFRSWAVRDPATAAAKSLTLADEPSRFRALAAVVKEWSANDLAAVGRWASELEDPHLKDFATMAVADEMSLRAPKEAMRWASDHLAKDPQANPAIISLVASKAGFESPQEDFRLAEIGSPLTRSRFLTRRSRDLPRRRRSRVCLERISCPPHGDPRDYRRTDRFHPWLAGSRVRETLARRSARGAVENPGHLRLCCRMGLAESRCRRRLGQEPAGRSSENRSGPGPDQCQRRIRCRGTSGILAVSFRSKRDALKMTIGELPPLGSWTSARDRHTAWK
jgi:hypothetical protein